MNISATFLSKRGVHSSRILSSALFAALTARASAVMTHQRTHHLSCTVSWASEIKECAQYLEIVGVAPLRFALPPEPATERPIAARPVQPQKVAVVESHDVPPPPAAETPTAQTPEVAKIEPTAPAPTQKPISILPDDTPRDVHAEDVLPYFQLSRNKTSISGPPLPFQPASPSLPASSASYELK